mgnify:CR=1 FL=1
MKLSICIPTYNRNESLKKCIKSINKIKIKNKIKINIIIVDNSKNNNLLKIKKQLIKNSKFKILFLSEKKRGIVFARNKCLKKLKISNPDYICFFDDDCVVDKNWLKNSLKTIKLKNADIVTGPQIYLNKKVSNYSKLFEKNYGNKKIYNVQWAASNNVLINYKIIKKNKLFFDKKLNKFGVGEDQLFFSKLNSYGSKIYWSKDIKVFENIHKHRLKLDWLIRRSFRLGVAGYYIDISVYGKTKGFIMNYLKCIYYFTKASLYILLFFKHKLRIQILNFFSRFYGRLIGPFMLKKIDFLKK